MIDVSCDRNTRHVCEKLMGPEVCELLKASLSNRLYYQDILFGRNCNEFGNN